MLPVALECGASMACETVRLARSSAHEGLVDLDVASTSRRSMCDEMFGDYIRKCRNARSGVRVFYDADGRDDGAGYFLKRRL